MPRAQPDMPPMRRKTTQLKGGKSPEAIAMRRAMRESDPKRLGRGTIRLPEEDTGDRQHFLFYQDEGGLRATDEENAPTDTIYYLGIIDILTPYSGIKKLEHLWKRIGADPVSALCRFLLLWWADGGLRGCCCSIKSARCLRPSTRTGSSPS